MVSSAALGWEPYREHKAILHDNRVCVHILRSTRDAAAVLIGSLFAARTFISRLAHVYVCCRICMRFAHTYCMWWWAGQFSTAILVYWALLAPLGSRLERNSILTCLPTSRPDRSNQLFFAEIHFCNVLVRTTKSCWRDRRALLKFLCFYSLNLILPKLAWDDAQKNNWNIEVQK